MCCWKARSSIRSVVARGRRYGLITDASQRFERGVDPRAAGACDRACYAVTVGMCRRHSLGHSKLRERPSATRRASAIRVRHQRVQHVLGAPLSADVVTDCLTRLGMTVEGSAPAWSVTPPSWRFDISIEEDLIEEVARLYGFDNIPEQNEIAAQRMQPWSEARVRNERAADLLVDRGYQEAITYSFTEPATAGTAAAWTGIRARESYFCRAGRDARIAVARPVAGTREQSASAAATRAPVRGRSRYSGTDGAETEVVAGVARALRCRSSGASRRRRSISST